MATAAILTCDGADCGDIIFPGDPISATVSGVFDGLGVADDPFGVSIAEASPKSIVLCGTCSLLTAADIASLIDIAGRAQEGADAT